MYDVPINNRTNTTTWKIILIIFNDTLGAEKLAYAPANELLNVSILKFIL
jgi:hypothetical protein